MTAPEALTYDKLVSQIILYCERAGDQDFIDEIPNLIMLAEQRLALEAKGLGFLRVVSGNLAINDPVLSKPDRWRQTKSFFYTNLTGKAHYLRPRKYEYCRIYAAGEVAAPPEFYSDYDFDHYFLALTPDQSYAFELSYYERPTPLSSSVQTNWTTRYAPQLILYACLLEAQPFLKDTNLLGMWQSQYAEIIASLQKEDAEHNHDNTEDGR